MKTLVPIKILLVGLLLLNPYFALGEGTEGRGGGDFDGLQAATSMRQAISKLNELSPSILTEQQLKSVNEIAPDIRILVIDKDLPSSLDGIVQFGSAYSIQGKQSPLTLINRFKWRETQDPFRRQALMVHELFVLLGFEATADYKLSSQFYEAAKSSAGSNSKVQCYLQVVKDVISYMNPSMPSTKLENAANESLRSFFGKLEPSDTVTATYSYPDSIKIAHTGKFAELARYWGGTSVYVVRHIRQLYKKNGVPHGCASFVIID